MTEQPNQFFDLLKVKEDLHPDLVAATESGPLGPMIRHPLIVEIHHPDEMNHMTNERYKHKRKEIAEAREAGDWDQFVWTHARPFRFEALLQSLSDGAGYYDAESLTEKECELIAAVWIDAENPGVNRDIWVELFADMPCPALDELPDKFRIYRGTVAEDDDGISWTLDENTAKFFANRFNSKGVVKSKIITRADALYYTDERGEKEVIFDPCQF